jgi:C1A family cysteine protease
MIHTKNLKLGLTIICAAAVLALPLSSALAYQGPPEDLDQIRNAIAAKGARWHADETSVSRLSHEEKRMRLGLNEDLPFGDLSSSAPAPIPMVTAAPPTLDWRNVEGISYVTPVKNQSSCGSCWAFAVTAALESQVMIATGGQPLDLSEQILVSCSGAGSCSGGSSSTASTFIKNVGLPAESCFPYTATNNSCTNACVNWQSNTEMVNGWHSTSGVDNIRSALFAYGPVLATMYVYNDFYSYRSGVYSYATGSYVGAHAVLVVGYDDVNQCFIVKNSWGTGWGEAGYFEIAYTEVTGTSRFGYSVLVYDGYKGAPPPPDTIPPTVSIVSPASGATVSGTTTVSVSASDNVGVTSVALYLDGALMGNDTTSPFSFAWNTLTASNGQGHSLQAVAYDAAVNSATSTAVNVTVNNVADTTPPTVMIASPAEGSTVSKIVKVNVNAADGSPLQRVEAYVDGKLLGSVSCAASTCSSSFKWNTNNGVAKGQHTITAYAYDTASNKGTASVTVTK